MLLVGLTCYLVTRDKLETISTSKLYNFLLPSNEFSVLNYILNTTIPATPFREDVRKVSVFAISRILDLGNCVHKLNWLGYGWLQRDGL